MFGASKNVVIFFSDLRNDFTTSKSFFLSQMPKRTFLSQMPKRTRHLGPFNFATPQNNSTESLSPTSRLLHLMRQESIQRKAKKMLQGPLHVLLPWRLDQTAMVGSNKTLWLNESCDNQRFFASHICTTFCSNI